MHTFKHGADLPNPQTAQAGKLTKGELEEEEWNATEHKHDEVRQHEGTWRRKLTRKSISLVQKDWEGYTNTLI